MVENKVVIVIISLLFFPAKAFSGLYFSQVISFYEIFTNLDQELLNSEKNEIRNNEEDEIVINYHETLGLYIRNNWNLWHNTDITEYFNKLDVYHPDEMSSIILIAYHRHLNNSIINIEGIIEKIKQQRIPARNIKLDLDSLRKIDSLYEINK